MIIDFSAHIIPPNVGKILQKKPYYAPASKKSGKHYFLYPSENADPKVRLSVMNRYGIDMQVLSQTTPVLLGFGAEEAARICRLSNDFIYDLCNRYPDRFAGCAIISLLDVNAALEELDRTVRQLGFKCVTISTNQNGKGLDSMEYFPFYERVVKYDVPVFLHPTNWEGYPLVGMEDGLLSIFGWPFDTSQAVWRLIFRGVLDRFPTLKIVTHHLGGMFPYFSRRVVTFHDRFQKKLQRPIESYFGQIYGDTALNGGPVESLMCGYAFFGADRIVFGTDYPFAHEKIMIQDNLECINKMPIPREEKEKILGENAGKLLKIN
ncbi:MAG: amidohydrolase family protein [Candidatus Bathyarchaeia archaeon]